MVHVRGCSPTSPFRAHILTRDVAGCVRKVPVTRASIFCSGRSLPVSADFVRTLVYVPSSWVTLGGPIVTVSVSSSVKWEHNVTFKVLERS